MCVTFGCKWRHSPYLHNGYATSFVVQTWIMPVYKPQSKIVMPTADSDTLPNALVTIHFLVFLGRYDRW
jgi:hypothetical protein